MTALLANRWVIVGVGVAYLSLMAVALVGLSSIASPPLLAFFAGAAIASLGWMVLYVCGGSEHRRLRDAAWGEEFTSMELRDLPHDWIHVDNVEFHGSDVDHVLVGPGGVFALETKWTNVSWSIKDGRLSPGWAAKAGEQSRRNAERIRSLLRGNYSVDVDVTPLLVVWGQGRPTLSAASLLNTGVTVLTRDEISDHIASRSPVLTFAEVEQIGRHIKHFVARKAAHELRQHQRKASGSIRSASA